MRLVDADAYEYELKRREKLCFYHIDEADVNTTVSEVEYWSGVIGTFNEAMCVLADAPTVGGWISVKDRLPEQTGLYIVYGCSDAMKELVPDCVPIWICSYNKKRGGWYEAELDVNYDFITHWMPLPKPPEEVNKDA